MADTAQNPGTTSEDRSTLLTQIQSVVTNLIPGATDNSSSLNASLSATSPSFGEVIFPKSLFARNDIEQFFYLSATELDFKPASDLLSTLTNLFNAPLTRNSKSLGQIYLPLPKNMSAEYTSNWAAKEGGRTASFQQGAQGTSSAWGGVKAAITQEAGAAFSGMDEGVAFGIATRGAMNPFRILQWQSPEFRTFSFYWELLPTNADDSEELNKVIYNLKKYMHSPSGPGSFVLRQPPLWNIKILDKSKLSVKDGNRFLFQMKDCAITNIQVDYFDKGAIFHGVDAKGGHAPNGVRLQISFTETSILTQNDFRGSYAAGPGSGYTVP